MEEVNNAYSFQAIRSIPHTFCTETFLNTPLEGHQVTIDSCGLSSDRFDISLKYSVVISMHSNLVYSKYNLSLQECIREIKLKCISHEQQIKLERNLLFDTPIE